MAPLQPAAANLVPNCALLLSSPAKFVPFLRPPSNKKLNNLASPNVVAIGELLQTSISSVADNCLKLLHSFASENPLLQKVLSLHSECNSFCHQVRFRNVNSISNHNFALILGDSVAGVVVANGVLNFLNIYNTLLVVRLVLTWFPTSPPAIVSPLRLRRNDNEKNRSNAVSEMANVSTNPFGSSVIASNFAKKPKRCSSVRCTCFSPSSGNWRESRRLVSISLLLSNLLLFPNESTAASIFDKYVKRKKLDPLESYVPAVILTQLQIQDLEKSLEVDQPQYDSCRSLLRSGPAASFRVNIRAVAQYASEDGNGKTATDDVDQCLRALEELDSMLLRASRNDRDVSVKLMKAKITLALNSLNGLLNTVPPDVLDKAKAIADSYRNSDEDYANPEISDPELKKLESTL